MSPQWRCRGRPARPARPLSASYIDRSLTPTYLLLLFALACSLTALTLLCHPCNLAREPRQAHKERGGACAFRRLHLVWQAAYPAQAWGASAALAGRPICRRDAATRGAAASTPAAWRPRQQGCCHALCVDLTVAASQSAPLQPSKLNTGPYVGASRPSQTPAGCRLPIPRCGVI